MTTTATVSSSAGVVVVVVDCLVGAPAAVWPTSPQAENRLVPPCEASERVPRPPSP